MTTNDPAGSLPAAPTSVDGYVDGVTDYEQIWEQSLRDAPRVPSGVVYHYTGADTAILGILASGMLRLSPFSTTNDLWESRPFYPSISAHADDRDPGPDMALWEETDRHIRAHAKVACLTQDAQVMDGIHADDALRGWAHLSLWAHYGAGGAGICLGFDQRKLLERFMTAPHPQGTLRFHGPVQYQHSSRGPVRSIDMGQIEEFGIDAAALSFAEDNKETVFFRKHADWANESEYRLVLIDQSVLPATVDIRSALTHIVLGECFPASKRPALAAVLASYPDVEVRQMHFHNRTVFCEPISLDATNRPVSSGAAASLYSPRRKGSLHERLCQLRAAEEEQRADAERARNLALEPLGQIAQDLSSFAETAPNGAQIRLMPRVDAVPEQLRQRAAGVPGEIICFEAGRALSIQDADDPYRVVVAAGAIQVLAERHIRIHGLVWREEPQSSSGVTRIQVWRDSRDTNVDTVADVTRQLLDDLGKAIPDAMQAFEEMCGSSEGTH
ncbi:DUF2971 domain-containing protein [Actinomadura syzygii]|uniref:DUF2971 domain-containing protein n=1 Tax=Actinomadura syzygii TaxID=1427538 RepID=A0A5D0UDK3_9ACTN|nr:DUF2971 domain-containing protein [Actinomadura syzygii]TYC15880.1 DUF2971 domain-containing protein [Actinomadura syzygii]